MCGEFKASTQYNDFYGTAAADRSDTLFIADLLPDNEKLLENESVIGFYIGFNGNSASRNIMPGVAIYIGYAKDDHFICTRTVDILLYEKDLFDLFKHLKRFNLSVSIDGKTIRRLED